MMNNSRTTVLIGALVVVVIAFASVMAIAMVSDGDTHDDGSPYSGMSGAMHDGDMADMMSHMQSVISEDDFAARHTHRPSTPSP